MTQRLHIFRAGRHVAMQGDALSFGEGDLAATAAAYDPARHEAPIVVGHPTHDAPAYGWVGGLSAEGGDLFAAPRQVDPAFAEMVEAGRFKKISASFYRPDAPANPKPGVWYLRHVGFLGAQPPAVKGLAPASFAAGDEGTVTVEFAEGWRLAWLFADVGRALRGLRDHLIADKGQETADAVLPADTVQRIADEAVRLESADRDPGGISPAFVEADPPGVTMDLKEIERREAEVAARAKQVADREAALRRQEDASFVEQLVAGAKLPAGLKDTAVAFLGSLSAETAVDFAEDGKPAKADQRALARKLLDGLPAAVDFRERGGAATAPNGSTADFAVPAGMSVDPDRLDLHRRALDHQRRHPGTDYVTAIGAVATGR